MASANKTVKAVEALDIIELALAINGGDPVAVKIGDHLVNVRRDFTGTEVRKYIDLFGENRPTDLPAQTRAQLDSLLESSTEDAKKQEITDYLMNDMPFTVASSIMLQLGKVAGLRGAGGNFLTGALSS